MGYVKNTWVDQDVERPKTYEVTTNQDGSITLTDSFGLVTELGTPVNATNMNHIENGLALSDLMKYDATVTYSTGEWVTGVVNNKKGIYASLVDNNVGNALSDDTKWEEVQLGGSTRNIGEIVQSTIPLTDAGLHLLDGALIDGNGIYSAFVDYIASIYDASASYFTTEASWQDSVINYGVCGKFVYDSVNNTVRLPKWGNQAYTIAMANTVPVIGNGTSLGLESPFFGNAALSGMSNSAYLITSSNVGSDVGTASTAINSGQRTIGLSTNSGYSGVIADLSNLTTSLTCYYYIVIATSTKTDIQVDIDEVVTDLNGKADVDLTNCTVPYVVEMSDDTILPRWYKVYSNGWCEQGGYSAYSSKTIALSKNYADTDYSIFTQPEYPSSSLNANVINSANKTTSGFTCYMQNYTAGGFYWETKGFIS